MADIVSYGAKLAHLAADMVGAWLQTGSIALRNHPPASCEIEGSAAMTAIIAGIVWILRSAHSHHPRIVQWAEYGIDLFGAGLTLALAAIVETFCLKLLPPPLQSGLWLYVPVALTVLGLLLAQRTLRHLVANGRLHFGHATAAGLSVTAGLMALVLCTGFNSVRLSQLGRDGYEDRTHNSRDSESCRCNDNREPIPAIAGSK